MNVRVLYFASLRDRAGCEGETLDREPSDLGALYDALAARHGFTLPRDRVRVAVNGAFAAWGETPIDGDEVAFLPPVSGG